MYTFQPELAELGIPGMLGTRRPFFAAHFAFWRCASRVSTLEHPGHQTGQDDVKINGLVFGKILTGNHGFYHQI